MREENAKSIRGSKQVKYSAMVGSELIFMPYNLFISLLLGYWNIIMQFISTVRERVCVSVCGREKERDIWFPNPFANGI